MGIESDSGSATMEQEGELRRVEKESLVNMTATVPVGEHWEVEDAVNSTITVPEGAALTIKDAVDCEIDNQGGVVTIENEVTSPQKTKREAAGDESGEEPEVPGASVDQVLEVQSSNLGGEKMGFCSQCGHPRQLGNNFCSQCGNKL